MKTVDLAVIGGGPAGMAAAVSAYQEGVRDVMILERGGNLGGILNQCIHTGFGLHRFGEELTGPEYAWKYEEQVKECGIVCKLNTMVTGLTKEKMITYINEEEGEVTVRAKAVILAMGCRERSRGALQIAGTRPAGILTAGTAQYFTNIKGYLPGRKAVILGSGDIGLIMARRMTLEGAKVQAVCELMPYSSGLTRNIVQCLYDFNIPLKLGHTIKEIHGKERVEGVTIIKADADRNLIPGTEEYILCDTILLSVGLIPENELTKQAGICLDFATGGAVVDQLCQTSVEGVFACGNVLHVHDLVDYVSEEAEIAGKSAAAYLKNTVLDIGQTLRIRTSPQIRYTVPQTVYPLKEDITVCFRVADVLEQAVIKIVNNGKCIKSIRKNKLVPGAMGRIRLSSKLLQEIEGDEIILQLERGE